MDRDWYQIDAMTKGSFPEYKLEAYRKRGVDLEISEEDRKAFQEGKIDFIGINYYSSSVKTALDLKEKKGNFFGGLNNPYLKTSDWGMDDRPGIGDDRRDEETLRFHLCRQAR